MRDGRGDGEFLAGLVFADSWLVRDVVCWLFFFCALLQWVDGCGRRHGGDAGKETMVRKRERERELLGEDVLSLC